MRPAFLTAAIIGLAAFAAACATDTTFPRPAWSPGAVDDDFTQAIDGTALQLEMVWIPATDDAHAGMWASKTEIPWEVYDAYVFRLDGSKADSERPVDAISRPSKPYIAMDRGFGHAGYPAISMSLHGALQFCQWLSLKTGRRYRLPTEQEWASLCARGDITTDNAAEHAWFAGNAERKTHAVASLRADALGLHDLWGNAGEWCTTEDGKGAVMGGTFRDPVERIGCGTRLAPTPMWNDSDPQFPKSIWWLADAGFIGFRIVCEKE